MGYVIKNDACICPFSIVDWEDSDRGFEFKQGTKIKYIITEGHVKDLVFDNLELNYEQFKGYDVVVIDVSNRLPYFSDVEWEKILFLSILGWEHKFAIVLNEEVEIVFNEDK